MYSAFNIKFHDEQFLFETFFSNLQACGDISKNPTLGVWNSHQKFSHWGGGGAQFFMYHNWDHSEHIPTNSWACYATMFLNHHLLSISNQLLPSFLFPFSFFSPLPGRSPFTEWGLGYRAYWNTPTGTANSCSSIIKTNSLLCVSRVEQQGNPGPAVKNKKRNMKIRRIYFVYTPLL